MIAKVFRFVPRKIGGTTILRQHARVNAKNKPRPGRGVPAAVAQGAG